MRVESKYLGLIVSVFVVSFGALAFLFDKYTYLTLAHFVAICKKVASSFFSSEIHYVGFGVPLLILGVMLIFLIKAVFSVIKTRKKIDSLLGRKISRLPDKLQRICQKHKLEQLTVVIDHRDHHALSFGLWSPGLLLSTGLIDALSRKELEAVVLHEWYHVRHRHPLILLVAEVIIATLFFLPVLVDVMAKMRSRFEEAADDFVASRQQTNKYLHLALGKTVCASSYRPYPSFARRRSYRLSGKRLLFSVGAVLILFFLLVLPTRTHVRAENVLESESLLCRDSVCSTDCVWG